MISHIEYDFLLANNFVKDVDDNEDWYVAQAKSVVPKPIRQRMHITGQIDQSDLDKLSEFFTKQILNSVRFKGLARKKKPYFPPSKLNNWKGIIADILGRYLAEDSEILEKILS